MAKNKALQAIRGMNDCLPSETNIWQMVESVLRRVASNYGFAEIRMPILESTAETTVREGSLGIVKSRAPSFPDRRHCGLPQG